MLSLQSQLLCLAVLLRFFLQNYFLRGIAFVQLVGLDFRGNQVALNTSQHVFILVLLHHLVGTFFGDLLHFRLRRGYI